MSKQDRQGVRTPADLERKYNIGKNFNSLMETATNAQRTAEQANQIAEQAHQTAEQAKQNVEDFNLEEILKQLEALSIKYIVESGISDIWHYEKWSDGTVDCRCVATVNVTSTSIGGLNRGDCSIVYPDFVSVVEYANCGTTEQNCWAGCCVAEDGSAIISIWSAEPFTEGEHLVSVHIKGQYTE